MMYPYLTLSDGTEIVHSEIKDDGRVEVHVETPDEQNGFLHATCWLPAYTWEDVCGYSDAQIDRLKVLVKNNAHLIMEFASVGGFENASKL